MSVWPIEEVLFRPMLTVFLCALVPFASARLLRAALTGKLAEDPEVRARQLFPLRTASLIAGLAQIEVAWIAGRTALGPALVDGADAWICDAFGLGCALVAFVAGGLARRAEELPPSSAIGTALLRVRLAILLAAPMGAAFVAGSLPLVSERGVGWAWLALAFAACAIGVAFGPIAIGLATGALRIAPADVRVLAMGVARAEHTSLWLVLRLPTSGARFANAAAIPWARTMIVTDAIVSLLSEDELRAVLAHEAGHLSEAPKVAIARLGAASLALFALSAGVPIAMYAGADALYAILGALAVALLLVVAVRRLARRMEERADERARATVGAAPLASALTKLHRAMLMPLVTGARRVHPDLYDRLKACGAELGERPPAPRRRVGPIAGLAYAAMLVGGAFAIATLTEIDDPARASAAAARWRLRVDPWDERAMLALAHEARREERYDLAIARARESVRLGARRSSALELEAEILAARGDCDAARATFDRSLEARAQEAIDRVLEEPIELGYHVPASLIAQCPE